MLIYKVYVYLAIQDLLETARVPIYIHTYIGNFFFSQFVQNMAALPTKSRMRMEVFCTYFGFEPHFTKSRKKTEKNMLKINLPQMSISCMALQKKNDHHTQVGG